MNLKSKSSYIFDEIKKIELLLDRIKKTTAQVRRMESISNTEMIEKLSIELDNNFKRIELITVSSRNILKGV